MTELDYLLSLNAISGLGSIRIRRLLDHFGSARDIFTAGLKELTSNGMIPPKIGRNIIHFNRDDYLKREYALAKKHDVQIITYKDKSYPDNLKELNDAPIIIYVKGTLRKKQNLAIGIVGSRRASVYGISIAEKLAVGLSELGITIVSGMARGIDTAAHRGALRARGSTVAVFGCGLSRVYPPENKRLLDDIVHNEGAILSEFFMEEQPLARNFPKRNRVISGLSLGIVVVEASQRSGALITSDYALEQGKEVFAVPGKVDSPNSQGVHNLIKQGAKLINGVEDILEELEPQLKYHLQEVKEKDSLAPLTKTRDDLSKDENQIYKEINDKAVQVDELADRCGFSASNTMNILLRLELKRLIKQLPGKRFIRV